MGQFLIVPSTIYIGAHLIYVYTSSWNISPIWYTSDENGLSSSHIGYKRTNIWRKERKTDELLSNYSSLMLQRETLLQKVMNPWNFIAFSLHIIICFYAIFYHVENSWKWNAEIYIISGL